MKTPNGRYIHQITIHTVKPIGRPQRFNFLDEVEAYRFYESAVNHPNTLDCTWYAEPVTSELFFDGSMKTKKPILIDKFSCI